jgi:muramoyltetrapeptide carboxypeptidase LdcA involved in peptidoglycan recycling
MEDKEFINAVKTHPKIFMGFSDTTNNHLMFYKLGLQTFYGQAFLTDLAELDTEMVPYTKKYFEKLFMDSHTYEITSSPVWYFERENFGPEEIGKPRNSQIEKHGFEVLNGKGKVIGELYGGCIESLYDAYTGERHGDDNEIYVKYNLLPTLDEWKEKILFLETSEEQISPDKLEQILMTLKNNKILENVKGILVGKPMNEKYYEEYKEVYRKVVANLDTPVLYNVNFGHSIPRCIIPYGAKAIIDYDNKKIAVNI